MRDTDVDRPGEGMVPGTDSAARRVLPMSWLLIADEPSGLPAKRAMVQAACRMHGNVELPLVVGARELRCRARKLIFGRDFENDWRHVYADVEFAASDPWWYDTSDRQADFALGDTATFFPIFPLRLSSSEVFADATIDNDGDTDAWPVWTIAGPGSDLVLRNITTDKMLSLNRDLSAGEIVTIDTRPRVKTVTLQDGTNLFPLAAGSLWPLAQGVNAIRAELTAATTASVVSLRYRRRWIGVDG